MWTVHTRTLDRKPFIQQPIFDPSIKKIQKPAKNTQNCSFRCFWKQLAHAIWCKIMAVVSLGWAVADDCMIYDQLVSNLRQYVPFFGTWASRGCFAGGWRLGIDRKEIIAPSDFDLYHFSPKRRLETLPTDHGKVYFSCGEKICTTFLLPRLPGSHWKDGRYLKL